MGSRGREARRPRTAKSRRAFAARVLVVCGGLQTEKRYLDGLRRAERNPAVTVTVRTNPRSPSEVVNYADRLRRQDSGEYDEIWCVFDVDEFRNVAEALRLADRKRINVAISNPCFELWLLLHCVDHTAYVSSYAAVVQLLRQHIPRYDKSRLDFADFEAGVVLACGRAKRLDPTGEKHELNPSTSVWRVVEKILRTP